MKRPHYPNRPYKNVIQAVPPKTSKEIFTEINIPFGYNSTNEPVKVKQYFPSDITLDNVLSKRGIYGQMQLGYVRFTPNPNYAIELVNYNAAVIKQEQDELQHQEAIKKYDLDMEQYKLKRVAYNKWLESNRISRLETKLEKLKAQQIIQ